MRISSPAHAPISLPGLLLVALAVLPSAAAAQASCFILPGANTGVTESYRVSSGGVIDRVDTLVADGSHVRAAFHPNGRVLYVTAVTSAPRIRRLPDEGPGVRLLAHSYDPATCSIGPRLDTARPSVEAPSSERAYGLLVHPDGRFLYQTTASLGRIRLYDLDESGMPAFRTTFDATAGGEHTCAQVRRLALHPAGRVLYVNCNNRDAGEGADHALQVWSIGAGGALTLLEHRTLDRMDGGILDPVAHPSGDWLYQPVSSNDPDAPGGAGPYVRVFRVTPVGALEWHEDVEVRLASHAAGVEGGRLTQAYPITLTLGDEGRMVYVALHVIMDGETFPHGHSVFDVEDGGGSLRQRSTTTFRPELKWSSHHGGTLIRVGPETYWFSYLTDYGNQRGGAIVRYRVRADGSLEALPDGPVTTGVTDGRQLIAAPDAGGASSRSDGPSSGHRGDLRNAFPLAPLQVWDPRVQEAPPCVSGSFRSQV